MKNHPKRGIGAELPPPHEPPQNKGYPENREFYACLDKWDAETKPIYHGMTDYVRILTALFGYDLTKKLTGDDSEWRIKTTVHERFCNPENDKVVLATIGSVLQICKILSSKLIPQSETVPQARVEFDFEKFCQFVERLYGCNLRGHTHHEVGDFRYHVMAYLKGRSAMERGECDGVVPPRQ